MEGKVNKPEVRKIITYEENREDNQQRRTMSNKVRVEANNKKEENRNNTYYKQFNHRRKEITKDKRGIAYKRKEKEGI